MNLRDETVLDVEMRRLSLALCALLALGCGNQCPRPKPTAMAVPEAPAGWCLDGKPTALAAQAIAMLRAAGDQGLLPSDYSAEALAATMERLSAPAPAPEAAARFERAMGAAFERYLTDVHRGRADPQQSGFDYHPGERHRITELVASALAKRDLARALADAEPGYPQYQRLKTALARYRALAAEGMPPPLPPVSRVSPGEAYAGLPLLAARLRALGDLPEGVAVTAGDRYDGALVAAVRRFQARHGLAADGILGPATLSRIDVPLELRVHQLELALERLRWLPHAPSRRFVAANVPAFRLVAFDRAVSDDPVLESAIVVGEAARQRTPFFTDSVRYILFRPSWYPTRGIIEREILPALRHDSPYLAREQMDLVARGGDDAPALPATKENLARLAAGSLRLRQRPGPHNALGLVKFGFPNHYDVYLHDTPDKQLFGRARRDFSHGCIRVQKPAELAAFLLTGMPEWNVERIRGAMEGERTFRVDLPEPVPVFLYYTTAIVRWGGTVEFFDDVYGLDATLDAALSRAKANRPAQP